MGIVFFATPSFEFFFQKSSSNLEMWDPYHLPFSKKFLYSVYHHCVLDPPYCIPPSYSMRNINASLILSLETSFFIFPIKEIHAAYEEGEQKNIFKFEIHSIYNECLYNRLKKVTTEIVPLTDGELRTAPTKGAIIFHDERKNKNETYETAIGILSFYTPEEIEKIFM